MGLEKWKTERLLARQPTAEDRADYHAHFSRREIESWLRPPPLPAFDARTIDELLHGDRVHWSDHGFGPWVLIEKESRGFVGRGGITWASVEERPEIELPWSIEPQLQGNGLATEAALAAVSWAAELGFEEVIALTRPANLASQRVAEKAGFRQDGRCQHAGLPHVRYRRTL